MTQNYIESVCDEFEKRFPVPMRKVEKLKDLGINTADTGMREKILDEQEYNVALNTWNNHRKFLIRSLESLLRKAMEALPEERKYMTCDMRKVEEYCQSCANGMSNCDLVDLDKEWNSCRSQALASLQALGAKEV